MFKIKKSKYLSILLSIILTFPVTVYSGGLKFGITSVVKDKIDELKEKKSENDTITYAVSDLEGTWYGYFTITHESSTETVEGSWEFDSQGNLTSMTGGPPNIISLSGNLNVTQSGEINGTIYMVYTNDSESYVIESTTGDIQGHFLSKTKIGIEIKCVWTNSEGEGGSYTVTGDFDQKAGSSTLYYVYGGNTYISSTDGYHPENHGYTLLGSADLSTTKKFVGTYDYYAIVVYSSNIVKIDAFQMSDGSYYSGKLTTGNTLDYSNVTGAQDGEYATVGNEHGGSHGGYVLISSYRSSSVKVYVIP